MCLRAETSSTSARSIVGVNDPDVATMAGLARAAFDAQSPTMASMLLRAAEELAVERLRERLAGADSGQSAFDDLMGFAMEFGVACYVTDEEGYLRDYNAQAVALWGWEPPMGCQRWGGAWRLAYPNGQSRDMALSPMAIALKERRVVSEDLVTGSRPDGTPLAMRPLALPVRSSSYGLLGGVNMLLDVRARHAAERMALRGGEAR